MQDKVRAYKDEYYPPIPTKSTLRHRRNFFVQLYRFFRLNYKIMRIVARGHS